MPSISVLIKPASGKCNLRCEYCFYHDEAAHRDTSDFGLMSVETLETIVSRVFAIADTAATFSFQGGEPTIRGLDFYRTFIELEHQYNEKGIAVTNCLQTNGILIDEEWADFLGKNGFLIGLSLDGPRNLQDRFRRHPGGGGTYAEVMRAAKLLNGHHVEYNILFTITSETVKSPGKVYSFLRKIILTIFSLCHASIRWKDSAGAAAIHCSLPNSAYF